MCEKQPGITAKFQIGHHVWLLCHSHVLVGVPLEQLEHRLDERWNRWPDLDLGHCVVGFYGCIPFHGRGTTLTRHAMIPLSLHTLLIMLMLMLILLESLRWVRWLLLREVRQLITLKKEKVTGEKMKKRKNY